MSSHKPLVLIILDGWGNRESKAYNAIAEAHTPQWDNWWQHFPHLLLEASGESVGLPKGQMGNSEVGHMHMGAGRLIPQELTRINQAIEQKIFFKNPVLTSLIQQLQKTNHALHVMGLLSEGGVHSHQKHLFAFLALCQKMQFHSVYLHLFLDGRDCPPQSALASLHELEQCLKNNPVAKIVSISGRYFAMDRDKRWDRTEKVYRLMTEGLSPYHFNSAEEAVQFFYKKHIYDEFIPPTLIGEQHPIATNDALFFFNFRADRARQLTQCFVDEHFTHCLSEGKNKIETRPKLSQCVTMTGYSNELPTQVVFPTLRLSKVLGEVIANQGLKQLRIAETEKYAHVTFFLNGGREEPFLGEDRHLVPSPKVATYDLKPEMSAVQITQALIKMLKRDAYDVYIVNYANADMVGHTGNFSATVKAIECLDHCLMEIGTVLKEKQGFLLLTADHGNAEIMFDPLTNQPHTAHTHEKVPFLFVGQGWHCAQSEGNLMDIAPTILALLGIAKPPEMTGQSLLVKDYA